MTIDWRGVGSDAWARWRADHALLWPLAGLFLFLPQYAFYLLASPAPALTAEQARDTAALFAPGSPLVAWMTYNAPGMLATALLATFGSLAILCLYLAEGAGTPARALVRAIGLFPRFLLAVIVTGLPAAPVELMLVILVLPCLYLLGRIALTAPVIVAERPIGVFAAIGRSVAMTRKRGFSMMAFAAVVMLTSMIAPMPFRLLHDAMQADATANPVAVAVVEGAGSLLAAIISLATLLLEVALYRRLAGSISGT